MWLLVISCKGLIVVESTLLGIRSSSVVDTPVYLCILDVESAIWLSFPAVYSKVQSKVMRKSCYLLSFWLSGVRCMNVEAQVIDLHYNSSNLCSNCIIGHMLTKSTDHPSGICGWGVSMLLKGFGIRKCMSSGLASCMFPIPCFSIIFCPSLFLCYHRISLGICSCISAELSYVCQTVGVWIGKSFPN